MNHASNKLTVSKAEICSVYFNIHDSMSHVNVEVQAGTETYDLGVVPHSDLSYN